MPTAAVFIDGPWLCYALKRIKPNLEINFKSFFKALREHFGDQTPIYYYDVVDSNDIKKKEFINQLTSTGYLVELARLFHRKKGGKDSFQIKGLDSKLIVGVNSLPREVNIIVLISGDSDYSPMVEQLVQSGKKVILISGDRYVSHSLVIAAESKYVPLKKFLINLQSGKELFPHWVEKEKQETTKNWYFEKGEHYSPYIVLRKLFLSAKSEVTLIDAYIDEQILRIIALLSPDISVKIFANKISPPDFDVQLKKLRNNGYKIKLYKTNSFHDRFLAIDQEWWHSGHSFKDIGSKVSVLTKIEDKNVVDSLRKDIDSVLSATPEYF